MAFDNKQKGQKNYLDHGYNTIVYHTITSFVLFNYNSIDQIQNQDLWLHKTPLIHYKFKSYLRSSQKCKY